MVVRPRVPDFASTTSYKVDVGSITVRWQTRHCGSASHGQTLFKDCWLYILVTDKLLYKSSCNWVIHKVCRIAFV